MSKFNEGDVVYDTKFKEKFKFETGRDKYIIDRLEKYTDQPIDKDLTDNISICTECGERVNDDTNTKWDKDAQPYCGKCFNLINS